MKKLTGYPSIDNIHNSDYSFFSRNPIIPNMSIYNTINLISNFYRKEEAIDCLDLRVNYGEMLKDAITLSKTLKELGINMSMGTEFFDNIKNEMIHKFR